MALVAEDEPAQVSARLQVAARKPSREFEKELVLLCVLEGVSTHGGLGERFFPAGEWSVYAAAVSEACRHVLRKFVDLSRGVPECPSSYSHRPAQRHGLGRRCHGHSAALIPTGKLIPDLVTSQ